MRWNSIRTKLILFMLIATIVPTVATMVVSYSYTTDSLKRRAIEENRQLMFQGKTNLGNLLDNLNRTSLAVYTDHEFFRQLELGYDDYTAEANTYVSLQNIAAAMGDIWQVYLYRNKQQRATLVIQSLPRRMHDVALDENVRRYAQDGISMQPTHLSGMYGFNASPYYFPSIQVFTLHRPIYRMPSSERLGYLSIDVKLEALSRIAEQLYARDKEQFYLVDDEGVIFYSGDREAIGRPFQETGHNPAPFLASPSGSIEADGSLFVHERVETPLVNMTLIKIIPKHVLLEEANRAAVVNMLLIALSLVVIIIATIIVSFRITRPIRQLVRYISQVQTGNLNVDIQPAGNDEIGVVSKRFRNMMDRLNNLIVREYQLEIANKTNQLKALQAQINPHFMNNALQSIGTLALQHKAPQIYKLVTALARMMRYSMYTDESTVTLREEIDHAKAYLQLQAQRFENAFDARFDLDSATLDLSVPKMTLQPLIENYFKHGLEQERSGGWLRIASRIISRPADGEEAGMIEITVEDNGRGMALQRRIELNERLEEVHPERLGIRTSHDLWRDAAADETSTGIGLVNVLTRLQLFSNGQAKLRIGAVEPRGTRITILIKGELDSNGSVNH
ncbi:sensor histidine kinase [Paenibacillus dendritiformis]|uniref:sensor histidine kinase n=1 Tax=Paenibacillus dendritiformis TaxID=130049 RepID=UPI000DA8A91D|nr:sensor histidine kinase [Paenibacillus dendritiformis]PZM65674.1 sensor histidine kinase [Paenibacillus dendritiformis]